MRRFIAFCPKQIDNVLAFSESLADPSGIFPPEVFWFGRSIVKVTAWDMDSFAQAALSTPGLFGPEVKGFVAGAWSAVTIILSLSIHSLPDPVDALASFLNDCHAPVTIKRSGSAFGFVVPDKSARKRVVLAGKGTRSAHGVSMELSLGAKFRLGDFLRSLGSETARHALVEILRIV